MPTISFEPGVDERYLDNEQLGHRWQCHQKTAARRAKLSGIPILLLGGQPRYPLSEIIIFERAAVSKFTNRKTVFPKQFAGITPRPGRKRKQRSVKETAKAVTQ
jgi:hypothetical protein